MKNLQPRRYESSRLQVWTFTAAGMDVHGCRYGRSRLKVWTFTAAGMDVHG
ncbi:MAG: hypothetical protein IJK15_09100 [Bacteroidaceae bacterium]|nr:hypothetical protein [Bacteroidaceae bacterium]